MPIKANQLSTETKELLAFGTSTNPATSPTNPGAEGGIFYPKKFGDVVDACFKNNQGAEIRLTVAGVPVGESNTASNVGSSGSLGLFKDKAESDLRFKSLLAGSGITITAYDANTVQIASTVTPGETNDGLNIGSTGLGVFYQKDPTTKQLKFKKLVPGSNIDIVESGDQSTLTISVSNLAQNTYTGSNVGTGEGNVFKEIANNDFKFKRLKAGTNTTVTETSTEITISSTGGVGSGEANTASNSAAGTGLGLFKQKVGTDLVFKKIKAGAGLALTSYDDDLQIDLSGGVGEANTASNATAGTGTGLLFKGKVSTDLVFRKLLAGSGVTITTGTDDITITATGGAGSGEVNTASNMGTVSDGEGLFTTKSGVDLPFKRIKAGSNISLTGATNSVTIAATGDVNAAANMGTGTGQVFKSKSANTLQFRTIKAGTNVTITNGTDDITIDATGGSGGTSLSTYAASSVSGDECLVTATGTGITYARTGDTGVFTIPVGVTMMSFMIRVPGAAITGSKFLINHGQGSSSQALGFPPIIQIYADGSTNSVVATASPKATDTGTNAGNFNQTLISTLTNGSSYRIRGAF